MATTTTLFAGLAYGFSVIPVVLIASSAIVLRNAMRYETALHRCQIQIGMWLALTLASSVDWSGNEDASDEQQQQQRKIFCFLWAHLVIFFNLSAVMLEALQDSSGLGISRRQEAFKNALQILPISSWWSMSLVAIAGFVAETTTIEGNLLSMESLWKMSLGAFVGITLILAFLRAVEARHRRISAGATLPTTTASDSMLTGGIIARICVMVPTSNYYNKPNSQLDSTLYVDERQWYTWSKLETIKWFVQQLNGDTEESNKILSILCKHCITGDVLDVLDASQLVALQVPFGPACKLADAIHGLVERFPKPRIINGIRQRTRWGNVPTEARPSRDYLDNYDDEYNNNATSEEELLRNNNNNNPPMEQQQQVNGIGQEPPTRKPQPAYPNESGGAMSEEQHEKLNQVMKDRFGLELPKLRATDFLAVQKGLNAQNNGDGAMPSEGMTQPRPFAASVDPMTNNYANGTTAVPIAQTLHDGSPSSARMPSPSTLSRDIPDEIFKGMPPELQEIAKRRPDLVEKIWKQKEQVLKANSKTRALPALPEILDEEEFDSDNEDETTSLIQHDSIQHRVHPGRYKSVDKSMLPSIV
mmetsp:Transcript_4726/g.11303  ORF Transcript_4726/g.11303 Transcript_4726/m.11303 type:complete len:588 (+) Transcript_4726:182-1945(+)